MARSRTTTTRRRPKEPAPWKSRTLTDLLREQADGAWEREPEYGPRRPRGWLLERGVGEVLEPFARLAYRRHDLTGIVDLDAAAARMLLERLDTEDLRERQNDAPNLGNLLRSIAEHPGVVTGIGYVVGPDRPDERFTLEGVLVDDPSLLAFEPDVERGPAPALLDTLDDERREDYLEHWHGCVKSSVMRQQWFAARHRYGIRGARIRPTEITRYYDTTTGHSRVRLWWT